MKTVVIFAFVLLGGILGGSSKSWALKEKDLAEATRTILEPFRAQHAVEGTVTTPDGQTIAYIYYKHPNAKATMMLMQGWTEH